MKRASVIVGLVVAGLAGCEQILGTDNYEIDGTSSSGAAAGNGSSTISGAGGGGITMSSSSVSSTSSGLLAPKCYDADRVNFYGGGHQILGYQNRCSEAQLNEVFACWDAGNWFNGCPLYTDPAAEDCFDCLFGENQVAVPVWLQPPGSVQIWIQYHACIAFALGLTSCIEAVQLEYCRTSVCDTCDPEDLFEASDCFDYATIDACAGIVLPAGCQAVFTEEPFECFSPGFDGRAKNTARVLCGPSP